MNNTKVLVINKEKVNTLIQFIVLTGIAVIAPLIGQQVITGSIVNAVLFVSTVFLGVRAGILVGLLPSIIALSIGLLPVVLAPMIAFIMTGNVILVMVFDFLRKRNFWMGVVTASILKFIFLFASSTIVVNLIVKTELAPRVAGMMSFPQLFTALAGGALAYLVIKSRRGLSAN